MVRYVSLKRFDYGKILTIVGLRSLRYERLVGLLTGMLGYYFAGLILLVLEVLRYYLRHFHLLSLRFVRN